MRRIENKPKVRCKAEAMGGRTTKYDESAIKEPEKEEASLILQERRLGTIECKK